MVNPGDQFSNLFTRSKEDGSLRVILNLKNLNEICVTSHCKMESIMNVISMIKPGAYFASIDLKDAFYSVPIHKDFTKYLKFIWKGKAYKFICMPNGYNDAMRAFTKILKVPFSILREMGHLSVIYVDDSFLMGLNYIECTSNIKDTIHLLQSLGFTIHFGKSQLDPVQVIIFLGFIFDSQNMTITLTEKKKRKIIAFAQKLLSMNEISIRQLASFLGYIVSSFPAVPYGKLHYRIVEREKIWALKRHLGNFDSNIKISDWARQEILWWVQNIPASTNSLFDPPEYDKLIYSDASKTGWGAYDTVQTINGRWLLAEAALHINVLEMLAMEFAIRSFYSSGITHMRVMSDNNTAICYLNNMGGTKSVHCDKISKRIWEFCISKNMWISAAHIPGVDNIESDRGSRTFNDQTEWMISDSVFYDLCQNYGTPSIDMFATRLNKKITPYVSWRPDPGAFAINCFSISWKLYNVYCFPPFSMIWKTLKKIQAEGIEALVIVPLWKGQSWYPMFTRMIRIGPTIISSSQLQLPGTTEHHPLHPKLQLLAAKIGSI